MNLTYENTNEVTKMQKTDDLTDAELAVVSGGGFWGTLIDIAGWRNLNDAQAAVVYYK
jgi:hypothetical protein